MTHLPPPEPRWAVGLDLSTADLYQILEIRSAIFVVEQQCPYQELDGLDLQADTLHLWLEDDQGIIAYLRLLAENESIRIGRVLTRPDSRRRGVSTTLMTAALQRTGPATTLVSAQSHLVGFYKTFGFAVSGPEFVEDEIPHVPMRRVVVS